MASERLTALFGKMKKGLSERWSELKPEDIAKFAAKEAVGVIPIVGQIIKDAFNEFSSDEKEELIKELKELSEGQFKEISEKVGVSAEYLKDIRKITLYTFEELQADHEEIKKLLLHLIEIQTRGVEVKPPEINIPTIQSTLRKGETLEGDFFKKEPEWIDFEEGFVVERKEVYKIIKKLENDNIQLVLGEPASGKSVILKNIGFKLAKENKDVFIVELKKHSRDEVKRYFDDVSEIKDEKVVYIVDDAHLQVAECERLVRNFKNRNLKAKLIIGSRPTRVIQGGHPKEVSEFVYLSKTDIHAEDVTEEMIKTFLKSKHHFSDERINTVSENLEIYKKDLWHLSWALKSYKPKEDSVEDEVIYAKVKESIRNISAGKDNPPINAEDVFLPLSVFYRFEIPVVRNFLEEQLELEKDKINELMELSEIIETEEIGRNRKLSLIHSSVADLYFKTYLSYLDLGEKVKKIFQGEDAGIEYRMFYKYIKSVPTNSLDVLIHLGRDLNDEIGGQTLLKRLIEDKKTENSIKRAIEKEGDIEKIGCSVNRIAWASEEVALKLSDAVSAKIEKLEDIEISAFSLFVWNILVASKKVGLELGNRINIDYVSSKIGKEEDIEKIGLYVMRIAELNKGVGFKLANRVNIKVLVSKIEKEEDVWKIGLCVRGIAKASKEVGLELANRVNVKALASKIEQEEDVIKIGVCMGGITNASNEMALKLASAVSSELGKREDMRGIEVFMTDVMGVDREIAREIVNRLNPRVREELQRGGG